MMAMLACLCGAISPAARSSLVLKLASRDVPAARRGPMAFMRKPSAPQERQRVRSLVVRRERGRLALVGGNVGSTPDV